MMNLMVKYLGFVLLLSVYGCYNEAAKEPVEASMNAPEVSRDYKTEEEVVERKLIKEGRVEFETNDLNATRKTIFEAVEKYKGYVSSDREFKSGARMSNVLELRMPSANFDKLLNEATAGVEHFESKEISVKDVTEEFLDVQSRLKTKKELELRYIDLLKQAKTVTEILEIEAQIGQLRTEIESIEGRLKYLQDRVSYSMLSMTFYESMPNESGFGGKFKNGFRNGWENLVWFFVALTNVWPFIVIVLGLIIGIRIYRRKK